MEPIERFMAKVSKPLVPSKCWTWLAATRGSREKRGCFWDGARNVDAARWMYQHSHSGQPIDGMVVMHRCDNPLCVNPAHLRLGSQADNVADMHVKSRAHQQRNPSVGVRAMHRAHETMEREPDRRARGERHGSSKLTDTQRGEISNSTEPTRVLAARYGVDRTQIQRVRRAARKALTSACLRAALTDAGAKEAK